MQPGRAARFFETCGGKCGNTHHPYAVIRGIGLCKLVFYENVGYHRERIGGIFRGNVVISGFFAFHKRFFVGYGVGNAFVAVKRFHVFNELRNRCFRRVRIEIFAFGIERRFERFGVVAFLFRKVYVSGKDFVCAAVIFGCRFVFLFADAEKVETVAEHAVVHPVGSPAAHRGYGNKVYEKHDHRENGKRPDAVR